MGTTYYPGRKQAKSILLLIIRNAFLVVFVALVGIAWFQSRPEKHLSGEYIQVLGGYLLGLESEGLVTAKEISVDGGEPFLFILRPQNSDEITDDDIQSVITLAIHAVNSFEGHQGMRHDDIDIAFQRPTEQKILLVRRTDLPDLISSDMYGEMTISIDHTRHTSLVNLAGPVKSGREDYSQAWSVIQALCLGYAGETPDADPICNVISANAAAGWVGMDRSQAKQIINGYGMTSLQYLGAVNYKFRFIDFVYDEFVFRYNRRKSTDAERAVMAIKGIEGKRLYYKNR